MFGTKQFHIGDVLSITTGYLVSPRGMTGVMEFIEFMLGSLSCAYASHFESARARCLPYLFIQFPCLASPEMDFAIAELGEMLKTPSGEKDPDHLVTGWISKLVSGKYGIEISEMLDVIPLPAKAS